MATYAEYLDKIRNIELSFLTEFSVGMSKCELNIHLLLNKLYEAKKSFLVLMDNERYIDAVLIAGHILENCATINYIISDLIKDTGRTSKYVAKNMVQTIYSFINMLEYDVEDTEINDAIVDFIDTLKTCGSAALKSKDKTNEQVIQELEAEKSNTKKKEILKQNYYFPIVEDFLRPFRKDLSDYYKASGIDTKFSVFYTSYCAIKHNGAVVCGFSIKDGRFCADNTQYREFSPIVVYMCLEYIKNKTFDALSKLKQENTHLDINHN